MNSIGLWQVDGKMPNLALMKLSAWLKAQGHDTYLQMTPDHTTAYGSSVFAENKPMVNFWLRVHPDIEIGGSGWNLQKELPQEAEILRPDYDLYGIDYGLGFLSRGCIHRCPFCIVPEKEGRLRQVAQVSNLLNLKSNFLVLLDNNLLALPNALDILTEIKERGLMVNFNQGLDIRLVTPEIARALADLHYMDFSRNNRTLHFAFDDTRLENSVRHGIEILLESGISSEHLCFYVLAGFNNQTLEDVLYRCDMLREYGVRPYVMRYRKNSRLNAIARWANCTVGLWRRPFSEYGNGRRFDKGSRMRYNTDIGSNPSDSGPRNG